MTTFTHRPHALKIQSFQHIAARSENGFTYIGILIAVAIIGVSLAEIGVVWHTIQQCERERELLYVGDRFREAIGRYYNVGAVVRAASEYPQSLDDLLRDPRLVGVAHYLRKIYYDPITGTQKWGLIRNSNGRIVGVYSLSNGHPIKQSNFSEADKDFEGKDAYSKWTFIYSPKLDRIKQKPRMRAPQPSADAFPNTSGQK